MSLHSNPALSPLLDVDPDAMLCDFKVIGPSAEPCYFIPQSALRRLLRGRTTWPATQDGPQQSSYNTQSFSSQYINNTHAMTHSLNPSTGPAQSSFVQCAPLYPDYASNFSSLYHGNNSFGIQSGRDQDTHPQRWSESLSSPNGPLQPAESSRMPSTICPAPAPSYGAIPLFQLGGSDTSRAPPLEHLEAGSASAGFPSKAPACANCYSSRKRCGWERPCDRCTNNHLVCIDRSRAPRRGRKAAPPGVHNAEAYVPQASAPGSSSDGVIGWAASNVTASVSSSHSGATAFDVGSFPSMGGQSF